MWFGQAKIALPSGNHEIHLCASNSLLSILGDLVQPHPYAKSNPTHSCRIFAAVHRLIFTHPNYFHT